MIDQSQNAFHFSPIKAIEWYLPFFLLLSQYKLGGISLGLIGLLIIAIIGILEDRGKIYKTHDAVVSAIITFVIYLIFRDVITLIFNIGSYETFINRILEYVALFLLSVYVTNINFDESRLYTAWKIAGLIFMIGLVYQVVLVYIFGRSVSPISIIPGYSLRADSFSNRPSSFFSEPASFVCALLPLEFMAIKNVDYKWAAITTFMIVLSTSTVGIVLSIILWLCVVARSDLRVSKKIIFFIIALIVMWAMLNLDFFTVGMTKLSNVLEGGSTVNSRIICGLDIIRSLNPIELIFGTNYTTAEQYVSENISLFSGMSPVLVYYRAGSLFLNSFSLIVFKYGFLGLIFYFNVFAKCIKRNGYEAKWYILMILVSIFAQSKFLNPIYFMEIMFILLYSKKQCPSKL